MFIYLHVPFCRSRCIYCDFYVVLQKYGTPQTQQLFVQALCSQIHTQLQSSSGQLGPIQSLYIGGGTPSLLPAEAYLRIMDVLEQYAEWAPQAERTLEVNPSCLASPLEAYRAVGFNRLSMGIQSFNNTELKRLSRLHTADEAIACVRQAQAAGFDNLSVDLMYGLPGQTAESWQQTLQTVTDLIDFGVSHVSMYGLKIEEQTPLAKLQAAQAYQCPADELTVAMYFQGRQHLQAAGLQPYEFSNFARPGMASVHNLNYWDNGEFLAFGPSACAYWQGFRTQNIRDLSAYLQNPLQEASRVVVSRVEQLENALIFGLRKTQGVYLPDLKMQFADLVPDFDTRYGKVMAQFKQQGVLEETTEGWLRLVPEAIPISNSILCEFLLDPSGL